MKLYTIGPIYIGQEKCLKYFGNLNFIILVLSDTWKYLQLLYSYLQKICKQIYCIHYHIEFQCEYLIFWILEIGVYVEIFCIESWNIIRNSISKT